MKHSIFFVTVMCAIMASIGIAQVPRYLSHQGFLTRSDGSPFDTTIAMTFKLYNDSTGGSAVWEETHPSVTVTQGVFNATLGRGTVFTIPFDRQYWLEVIAGAQTLTPRRRLAAATYSLGPWSTTGNDIYYNFGKVGVGTSSPSYLLDVHSQLGTDYARFGDLVTGNGRVEIRQSGGTTGISGQFNECQIRSVASPTLALYTTTGFTQVVLGTNSLERVRIDKDGNVGIGTTGPVGKLHLYGSGTTVEQRIENGTASSTGLRIRANGADVGFLGTGDYVSSGGSNSDFGLQSVGNLIFASSGGGNERMRITTAGNIGIGTASPGYKLDVRSTTPLSIAVYGKMTATSGSPHFAGQFENTSSAGTSYGVAGYATGAGTTNVAVYGSATGATNNYAAIFENGNVGIGTTSPSTTLHVTNSGAGSVITATNTQGSWTGGIDGSGAYMQSGGTAAFSIWSGSTRVASFLNSGNVGIGTTSPTNLLHVSGAGGNTVLFGSTNTVGPALTLGGGTSFKLRSTLTGDAEGSNKFIITNVGSSANLFTVQSDGNVGIGTTSPSEKLHVVGNICYTGTSASCSDIRYKKDVEPLHGTLSKVMSLSGVTYHWKTDEYPEKNFSKEKQIGLVAQEVEQQFPEVVLTDKEGYKSLDYGRLTAVLIEAVKEQQRKIDGLEKRLEKMENGVSDNLGEVRK